MRRLIDRTQIVESREIDHATCEICATETADYDEENSFLVVTLDSFLRTVNPRGPDQVWHPDWLPRKDTIRHTFSLDESLDESREAFARWAAKVRQSIPQRDVLQQCLPPKRS